MVTPVNTVSPVNTVFESFEGVLFEAGVSHVDRAAKRIKNVKILGLESKNSGRVLGLNEAEFGAAVNKPYGYTMEAVRQAKGLYEGATVYDGHLEFEYDENGRRRFKSNVRENASIVGWLRDVRVVEGSGLFGDLEYLDAASITPLLLEIADRNPNKIALSHEAVFGKPQLQNGKIVLSSIQHVDCVALVNSRPGTTNGLFEDASGIMRNLTIGQVIEATRPEIPLRNFLVEMGNQPGMAAMPTPATPVDTQENQVRTAVLAAIASRLERASVEQIRTVLEALQMSDSLSATAAGQNNAAAPPAAPPAPAAVPKPEKKDDGKPTFESASGVDRGPLVIECMGLLRDAGVKEMVDAVVIESMVSLPTLEKRQKYAQQIAAMTVREVVGGVLVPRSESPQPTKVVESAAPGAPATAGKYDKQEDFNNAIRRGPLS